MLSPEGSTLDEMKALTRALLAAACGRLTLTFHSPSVEPGHTPYVRTQAGPRPFLRSIERYCEFFFGELAGRTTTPLAFRRRLPAATESSLNEGARISPLDKDSTVTIVEDGDILYAAAEERFTRVKLQDGFPWQALQDGLDRDRHAARRNRRRDYPVPRWDEETRLFERNLADEREFLDEAENAATSAQLREAARACRRAHGPIPGLREPNERMEKGFAKTLAYRVLASEGVVSRNVAKRGSEQWGREASAFHRKWHEELEAALDELGLLNKLKRVEHHVSHAANAYYTAASTRR